MIVFALWQLVQIGPIQVIVVADARVRSAAAINDFTGAGKVSQRVDGILSAHALFVGILLQGLTMMNAPYYTQDFVKGAVLVIALIFTFALSKRGKR